MIAVPLQDKHSASHMLHFWSQGRQALILTWAKTAGSKVSWPCRKTSKRVHLQGIGVVLGHRISFQCGVQLFKLVGNFTMIESWTWKVVMYFLSTSCRSRRTLPQSCFFYIFLDLIVFGCVPQPCSVVHVWLRFAPASWLKKLYTCFLGSQSTEAMGVPHSDHASQTICKHHSKSHEFWWILIEFSWILIKIHQFSRILIMLWQVVPLRKLRSWLARAWSWVKQQVLDCRPGEGETWAWVNGVHGVPLVCLKTGALFYVVIYVSY